MNEMKIFVVAMAGSLCAQSMHPVPSAQMWANELLVRTLVSAAGGLLSTLAFKLIQQILWRRLMDRIINKHVKPD
ncbi:MAG: hypothetical protein QM786_08860 [Breznakibacter sp.]